MFDWRACIAFLVASCIVAFIVGLIATGLYMMYEMGNAWGFALVVGGVVLGGGIAAGFGL